MTKTIFENRTVTRQLRRRVPYETKTAYGSAQGFKSEPDGREELTYTVTADEAGLDLLAARAAGNKRGRAVDGPITVYITGRRRLPD